MKSIRWTARIAVASICITSAAAPSLAADVGTAFTYQGQLADNGAPANGVYDFQFRLFSGEFPFGFLQGSPVIVENVNVSDGKFTAKIDFGNLFSGQARWLDIGVRPGASAGTFTVLAPRQEMTPAPYAIGLALPYSAAHASDDPLMTLDQFGTGAAMSLAADGGNALSAFTSAGGEAVYAQTTGGGIPIYGYNLGASGNAAYFRSESASNASAAVSVQNNGTGPGVQASARLGSAGVFEVTNAPSNGRALDATTAGVGDASRITITNQTNSANALWAHTFGLGRAGIFEISNINSTATALEARTNGTGLAGKFVGDVEMHGDVNVDGRLYASFGSDTARATPIAYGDIGGADSGNVQLEVLSSAYDHVTWRITVQGETAPSTWSIQTEVNYSNPINPTHKYECRAGIPDAQGRFVVHLQCVSNCDVFVNESINVNFVVYKP